MQLTRNFSTREFTKSNTATRLGIDNGLTSEHLDNLKALCENILQPLRDELKMPIRITSGYRSKALNDAIGGSSSSQHCKAEASDLELWVNGVERNDLLYHTIVKLDLPFDQLIWEFGTDENPNWVHVSYGPRNRKQKLQAYKDENNRTKYRAI